MSMARWWVVGGEHWAWSVVGPREGSNAPLASHPTGRCTPTAQGIDMSAALVPATKCVALSKGDVPLKKMLYLYLRTSARQNPAVALLVVQTLLNDCRDIDATIRGAALRSMTSLRVPELMEAVYSALEAGLRDEHPYVRESAVLGVLKCHDVDPEGVALHGFLDTVARLLASDSDPQVAANCLYVMQQVRRALLCCWVVVVWGGGGVGVG